MLININIIGEGTVTGAGEYHVGDTASLSAAPLEGMQFGHYTRYRIVEGEESEEITNDPYLTILIEDDTDIDMDAYFYMDMRTYLTADYEFDIKHTALVKVASNRFKLSDDSNKVDEEYRDLATADLLMIVANTPSMIQGKTEKAGNWSETQGSRTLSITDKKDMRDRANALYDKWGKRPSKGVTATLKRVIW